VVGNFDGEARKLLDAPEFPKPEVP
ncbi:hypothetical protein Tco_1454115, partial [Tanacetum coccineum]